MELIIVILGISIAFQVNVVYEDNQAARRQLVALERFYLENELNLSEFESLMPYRINMEQNTRILHILLDSPYATNQDSIANYVFTLHRVSTPDLPIGAMNAYLNSNYEKRDLELEREMQSLKALYAELQELTSHYWQKKTDYFYNPIKSEVDFSNQRVVHTEKLTSLSFRNDLWSLFLDEIEQNRLYKESYDKLVHVQTLTEEALSKRK
jgi:hypothetical protein